MASLSFPHKPNLTFDEAVQVWLLHWDGHIQSEIAAHFPTNQGRVNEILNLKNHVGSREAALNKRSA